MTGEQKAWVVTIICIVIFAISIVVTTGLYYGYKQSNSYEKNAKITCEVIEVR